MSFAEKCIDISLTLASGRFGPSNNNTAEIRGHRTNVRISKTGGADMGRLEAAIFGLPLSMMNQLTTLGTQILQQGKNSVVVKAYEKGQTPATVFAGTISLAWADMRAMPEACFRLSAHAGLYEAVKPEQPTSIKGTADVKQVMSGLAKTMGMQFEGNDVDVKLPNIYLSGSARDQVKSLAQMAGVEWIIDNNTLAVWKAGSARQKRPQLISPQTGMVGYPAFNQAGIEVTAQFRPDIQFGQPIEVKSDLTPACGTWNIKGLDYELDAQVPRGKWFMVMFAIRDEGISKPGG